MTDPTRPPKWFGLFLLAYALYYIWGLFLLINYIESTWYVLQPPPEGVHTTLNMGFRYLNLAYAVLQSGYFSVALFLLFRQKRWGWILAVGAIFAFLTTRVSQMDIGIRSLSLPGNDWLGLVYPIAINTMFALYLLRHDTTDFFSITSRSRKNTIITGFTLALAISVTVRVIYRI